MSIVSVEYRHTEAIRDPLQAARETYLAGYASNTRRSYAARLDQWQAWSAMQPVQEPLSLLKSYVSYLRDDRKLAPRTVQGHVHTIKGLIKTAASLNPDDQRLLKVLAQLDLVKPPKALGEIQGKRLSIEEAQRLLETPGTETPMALRDTAMLGLMLTLGMRRSEVCNLTWGHITKIDGHWVIANLRGKHGRVRTMKLPKWLRRIIKQWGKACHADPTSGDLRVFQPMSRHETPLRKRRGITPHCIYKVVVRRCQEAGVTVVKPHDLRRTAALLARKSGASIEQVQVMLGHESPQTTSHYIGEGLDLEDHAVDYNPLKV